MDPDFDKPPEPPRPLLSDRAVGMICGTAIAITLLLGGGWLFHLHSHEGIEILKGLGFFLVALIIVLKFP